MQQTQQTVVAPVAADAIDQDTLVVLDDRLLSHVVGGYGPGAGWCGDVVSEGPGTGW